MSFLLIPKGRDTSIRPSELWNYILLLVAKLDLRFYKPSLRIPLEVVRITLNEIQREETQLRPSAQYRHSEISHVPSGDNFADMQID
jgi:hypothetical protein